MTQPNTGRPRRNNELLDAAEDMATGVGRLGYSLLSLGLGLLPSQSRAHMHNAVRELSYAFAELPRTFANSAGVAINDWAADADSMAAAPTAAEASSGATAAPGVRRVRVPAGPPSSVPITTVTVATGVMITHIEYDPPGRDLDGEYVLLRNTGATPAELTGWTLRDGDSKHLFIFPAFTLAPEATVQLWTKAGTHAAANLYWGSGGAIWNNADDTGTLSDRSGVLVSSFAYAGNKAP